MWSRSLDCALLAVVLSGAGCSARATVATAESTADDETTATADDDASTDDGTIDAGTIPDLGDPEVCGDGIRTGDEACDDGNDIDTDDCLNGCEVARCGDGVIQTGAWCFGEPAVYQPEGGAVITTRHVEAVDMDHDGDLDVLAVGNRSFVYLNRGDGVFDPGRQLENFAIDSTEPVQLIDMDGDGFEDLVRRVHGAQELEYLRTGPDFMSTPSERWSLDFGSADDFSFVGLDANGDGRDDLAFHYRIDEPQLETYLTIALGRPPGQSGFILHDTIVGAGFSSDLVRVNVDGDGRDDLMDRDRYWLSDGSGGFSAAQPLPFAGHAHDLDGDGDDDLVTQHPDPLQVALNDGSGAFGESTTILDITDAAYRFADLDGDGDADIIATRLMNGSRPVWLHENPGAGEFVLALEYELEPRPWALTAADVTGDGALDIIAGGFTQPSISVIPAEP